MKEEEMKLSIFLVTALLAMTVNLPIAAQTAEGQLIEKSIPTPSLRGNLFAIPTEQPIAVYLPPSYKHSAMRFPVVYFLPGFGDAVRYFTAFGLYQGFVLKESMDQLIHQARINEMIVVIPNGINFMGGSFYVNSPVTGNWEDFIVHDVVNFVDSNFRTIPRAASRGLSGHSMGGFGALNIAMRHPNIFGVVYAMSPGLFGPNGLSKHAMFADSNSIDQYLDMEHRFGAMDKNESTLRFIAWMSQQLVVATDYGRCFAYAYGTAFSPDTNRNAPFIKYPFKRVGSSIAIDSAVWQRYEYGFGRLREKVGRFRTNLMKLQEIVVEFGTSDEHTFIPEGCRYFSTLLSEAGIPNQLVPFDGGHQDKLRERIEQHMLPYFSKQMAFE